MVFTDIGKSARRISIAFAAGLAAVALAAPSAQAAGTDYTELSFAGRWVTKTMTEGAPLGNVLVLKAGCGTQKDCYTGAIRFHYQDGKMSKPIRIKLEVKPDQLTVVWPDKATSRAKVVRGNLDLGSGCKERVLFASGSERLPNQCVYLAVQ